VWGGRILSRFNGNLLQAWQGISNPRALFPGQNRLTVLLVGQDYNHNNKGILYTKGSRADTIMLLSADLDKREISLVSIPRDTRVKAPDGKTGKINGTFSRGGIKLLKETIEDRFNVDIPYHVVMKPTAVKEIVDSVGGVEVETIDQMHYDDSWGDLHIHLPEGRQRLDGEKAVGFIRFRESARSYKDADGKEIRVGRSKEEGDIRRTARQQQLVQALVKNVFLPQNLIRADQIIDTGFGQIDTNLNRTQMLALATIFKSESKAPKSATLEGSDRTIGGTYYYVLDEPRAQATVDWLLKGDDQAARRLVRVVVKNGSGVPGAARKTADKLRELGYSSVTALNSELVATTLIEYGKATQAGLATELRTAVGRGKVQKASEAPGQGAPDINVVLGKDFPGT
jgi:LCP family protein required for cell wall assembly